MFAWADDRACLLHPGYREQSAFFSAGTAPILPAALPQLFRNGWGRFVLVARLPSSRIGLEDREGIALRILTHSKPGHTRQSNLTD